MDPRIAIVVAEKIEIGEVLDVHHSPKSARQIVLRMLIRVLPLLPVVFDVVDDVAVELAELDVGVRPIAKIQSHAVVAGRAEVAVNRRVDGLAEWNEVSDLEAISEAMRACGIAARETDARDQQTLAAIA